MPCFEGQDQGRIRREGTSGASPGAVGSAKRAASPHVATLGHAQVYLLYFHSEAECKCLVQPAPQNKTSQ